MITTKRHLLAVLIALTLGWLQAAELNDWRGSFREPADGYRPQPLWHLNGIITPDGIAEQMAAAQKQCGFGGVAVLPVNLTQPAFLSEDYFARYAEILNQGRTLGMNVIFYDDINFPSGSAGKQMKTLYPNDIIKRLDKAEEEINGPATYDKPLPAGILMAAVAMESTSLRRIDLTAKATDGRLTWQVPEGRWRLMVFTCVCEPNRPWVDYMDPQAVDKCFAITHELFYKRFPDHFGSTIKMSYFDDVGYHGTHRPWTSAFNTKFKAKYGFDPAPLYPALWCDIGPETASARVALFGFRAELLAEGYPRKAGEWAKAHGIRSTGHPPGNYELGPVDLHFDIFKYYRHVDIPLMDSIGYYGFGRDGFKLISSAADCYDRPQVSVEIYGAFGEKSFDRAMLYRNCMELFERGANIVLPHAMWYDPDPKKMRYPPLISQFSDKLRPELPDYSRWVARCSFLLQGSRRVSEVAILYPIAALEAYYHMDPPDGKWGKFVPPECARHFHLN